MSDSMTTSDEILLTPPAEAAALFAVDPKTLTRWANAGKVGCIRTIGGHRRYSRAELCALAHRDE